MHVENLSSFELAVRGAPPTVTGPSVAVELMPLPPLPDPGTDTRCAMLVRDPQSAHVYWDLTPAVLSEAWSRLPRGRACLCVWDVGEGRRVVAVRDVDLTWRRYELDGLRPDSVLQADVRLVDRDGSAVVLVESGVCRLPPLGPDQGSEAPWGRWSLVGPVEPPRPAPPPPGFDQFTDPSLHFLQTGTGSSFAWTQSSAPSSFTLSSRS